MPTTVIIEPDPGGHRFQAVANVAAYARRFGDVLLLTSQGAPQLDSFKVYLGDADLRVETPYDHIYPRTRDMVAALADVCRQEEVGTAVVMDADQSLKRWWYAAPRAFRGQRRPRVVFMLTRYPARMRWNDWVGWRLKAPKAVLVVLAMLTGSLQRAAGFTGRDDMSRGWIVKRTRDPDICTAHSRDRAAIREALQLPVERKLVGIFGVIEERKHSRMIWEAMQAHGIDADLLLAGGVTPEVKEWLATVEPSPHGRIIVRDGFLSNELLDQYVAAVDAAPLAMTLNGPSGIQGKALVAAVPVVTAGSLVRAREAAATGGGVAVELTPEGLAAGLAEVLSWPPDWSPRSSVTPATGEEFARNILGPEIARDGLGSGR